MKFNKRNIAACILSGWYQLSGRLRHVKARTSRGEILLSVYFHDPDRNLFESCVRWFLNQGYQIISLAELEAVAQGRKPFPSNAVVLTVDDGWKNNKENIAAVADQYGIPVTIFASTQPIETGEAYWWSYAAAGMQAGLLRKSLSQLKALADTDRKQIIADIRASVNLPRESMTIEELKQISAKGNVSIGSHTVTHPMLPTCTDAVSREEITRSKQILESWLSRDIPYFAYPNGSFTDREVRYLADAGYQLAFTTEPTYITPQNIKDVYRLPRFDVLETISFQENICRMTGVWFNR